MPSEASPQIDVSVVMCCPDDAATLARCIRKAHGAIVQSNMTGEVVVVDAGSANSARRVALELGARVCVVPFSGHAGAVRAGIESAAGRFIVTGEADGTYDFSESWKFFEALQKGAEVVVGNRYAGGIRRDAMSGADRYLKIPLLNLLGRLFFRAPIGDFHSGMLGLTQAAASRLASDDQASEFASETIARAALLRLRIAEVPITFSRSSAPQSAGRPQRLRFLLLRSPKWLFLYPGVFLLLGGALLAAIRPGWYGVTLGCLLTGFHICVLAVDARVIASSAGLIPRSGRFERLVDAISVRRGLLAGAVLTLGGVAVTGRAQLVSTAAIFLGADMVFSTLFLSLLRLRETKSR